MLNSTSMSNLISSFDYLNINSGSKIDCLYKDIKINRLTTGRRSSSSGKIISSYYNDDKMYEEARVLTNGIKKRIPYPLQNMFPEYIDNIAAAPPSEQWIYKNQNKIDLDFEKSKKYRLRKREKSKYY